MRIRKAGRTQTENSKVFYHCKGKNFSPVRLRKHTQKRVSADFANVGVRLDAMKSAKNTVKQQILDISHGKTREYEERRCA